MQGDIALEFNCADRKSSCRHQHRPATILGAGIDRSLHCGGVERSAIAFSAEGSNIVDTRTKIVFRSNSFSWFGNQASFTSQTYSNCSGNRRYWKLSEPLTSSQQGTAGFLRGCIVVQRKTS